MKYAIISLVIIVIIFILIIIYLKKQSNKTNIPPIQKEIKEVCEENKNPFITLTLVEHRKYQVNVYHSKINDYLTFRKSKDKRIKVLNNSKCIGLISAKDCKNLNLLQKKPEYFQGKVISFTGQSNMLYKVEIQIQLKLSYSKKVYRLNKEYLNKLVSIHSLFVKDQIIETSYGPSTILEVNDDHLIIDVPSLGTREIYNIDEIEIN